MIGRAGGVAAVVGLGVLWAVGTVVGPSGWARAAEQQPAAAQAPTHAELLRVREVEVVFDPPQLPPGRRSLADLRPEDLQVIDGGRARPVVRLEPVAAGGAAPWSWSIYLDLVLARPETAFKAAVAAAERAQQLAQMGGVDIVVADPRPQRLLTGSRDPARIEEVLAGVAARARLAQSTQLEAGARRLPPGVLRQQCDRLLTELNSRVPVGPHALLLAADPPWLAPPEMERLTHGERESGAAPQPAGEGGAAPPATDRGAAPAAGEDAGATLAETSRLLSAYGWLTVAMPLRSLPGSREPVVEAEMGHVQGGPAGGPAPAGAAIVPAIVALVQKMRGKEPTTAVDIRLVAPQLDPADASLVAFVRATAGTVVPYRELLRSAFDRVAGLWHLWYQAEAPPAGEARPLAIRVPARPQEVRAPSWVRTSIPAGLAAARLRGLLAGDRLAGPLALRLNASPIGHGQVLVVAASPTPEGAGAPPGGGEASAGPLRISFGWKEGEGFRVQHQPLGSQALALWNGQRAVRVTLPAPPAGVDSFAVLVEDLGTERWGGSLLTLPPGIRRD